MDNPDKVSDNRDANRLEDDVTDTGQQAGAPQVPSVTSIVYQRQHRSRKRKRFLLVSAVLYAIVLVLFLSSQLGPDRIQRDVNENLQRSGQQIR